jgi:hypothetical protein
VTEYEDAKQPGAEKRRSTRIIKSLPITVTGTDALGQEFRESTHTVMVNCYGCKYQSVHYVPKGTHVSVDVHRTHKRLPSRTVRGRVIWVQRPRSYQDVYHIGLEFEVVGNVWSLAAPPADWFPFPGDEEEPRKTESEPDLATAKVATIGSGRRGGGDSEQVLLVPSSVAVSDAFEVDFTAEMAAAAKPALRRSTDRSSDAVPERAASGERYRERQNLSMREMVREIVDEKLNEHSVTLRRHFDDSLQQLLEKVYERMQATAEESKQEIRAIRETLSVVPSPSSSASSPAAFSATAPAQSDRPNRRRRGGFKNGNGQA